ncbi:hypothetical protein B296_00002830, partial [Ensete ventricosum]
RVRIWSYERPRLVTPLEPGTNWPRTGRAPIELLMSSEMRLICSQRRKESYYREHDTYPT